MNRFIHFVKKEALHILRDTRTMLVVMGIPVLLTLLFGFAISTDVNNVNVAICTPDHSESIRKIENTLEYNPLFTFIGYVASDEVDQIMRTGDADAVLVFNKDYDRLVYGTLPNDEKAVQIVLDGSNPNSSASASAYLTMVLNDAMKPGSAAEFIETHILYNPLLQSSYNFVPGILGLIFILVCAMITSVSIVREKEMGTMEVLLVSPVKPVWIIVAKMIPYFILSCINLATVLLISKFALGVPMTGSIFGIILISLVYVILSLGFGLFVSTVADKQLVALLVSGMLLMVPVMTLSGMLFPTENLPTLLKSLSYIVPAKWYIDGIKKLMIQGQGIKGVWLELTILIGMTLAIIKLALAKFNDRLE